MSSVEFKDQASQLRLLVTTEVEATIKLGGSV